VHRFERFLNHNTDTLTNRFGATEAIGMREEMLAEYRALLPQVPDIGGRRNPLTPALGMSAWAVAVYRVVMRHGGHAQDAGDVLHGYLQTMVGRIPRQLRFQVLGHHRARVEKMARRSQQRRYPDDWVGQSVDGTGQPFDFGIDWTECGVRCRHQRPSCPVRLCGAPGIGPVRRVPLPTSRSPWRGSCGSRWRRLR